MTAIFDNGAAHTREANGITAVLAIPCGLACAGSVVPWLDAAVTTVLLGLLGITVLVGLVRVEVRWMRERREDRADAALAAAWPAAHSSLRSIGARAGVA